MKFPRPFFTTILGASLGYFLRDSVAGLIYGGILGAAVGWLFRWD